MDISYSGYHWFLAAARKVAEAEYFTLYDRYRGPTQLLGPGVPSGSAYSVPDFQSEGCDAVEEAKIVVVLLTVSYLEALANLYLALKMSPQHLSRVERTSLITKWTTIPSGFLPGYRWPAKDILEDIKSLVARRNGTVHPNPEVSRHGKLVHAGNSPPVMMEHDKVIRWIALPKQLAEHIGQQDSSDEGRVFRDSAEMGEMRAAEACARRLRAHRTWLKMEFQAQAQISPQGQIL